MIGKGDMKKLTNRQRQLIGIGICGFLVLVLGVVSLVSIMSKGTPNIWTGSTASPTPSSTVSSVAWEADADPNNLVTQAEKEEISIAVQKALDKRLSAESKNLFIPFIASVGGRMGDIIDINIIDRYREDNSVRATEPLGIFVEKVNGQWQVIFSGKEDPRYCEYLKEFYPDFDETTYGYLGC